MAPGTSICAGWSFVCLAFSRRWDDVVDFTDFITVTGSRSSGGAAVRTVADSRFPSSSPISVAARSKSSSAGADAPPPVGSRRPHWLQKRSIDRQPAPHERHGMSHPGEAGLSIDLRGYDDVRGEFRERGHARALPRDG